MAQPTSETAVSQWQALRLQIAVSQWQALRRQISTLQAQELELRLQIFASAFPRPSEGTNTLTMEDGAKLKADFPMTRKVDNNLWLPIRATLLGKGIAADDIVKYKPELAVGPYKKLPGDIRRMVDKAVTAKPGTPSLKVE